MNSPLPTNTELLIYLANDTGHTYEQAYTVWREYYRHPDAHLITETVLNLAKRYHLPIQAAMAVYEQGPSSPFVVSQPAR